MADLEYHHYEKEVKKYKNKLDWIEFREEAKDLINLYERKIFIFEEILNDLAPQLEDEQYCGTTSWNYEDELKLLDEKESFLEEQYEKFSENKKQELFLKDIGMSQDEYDKYLEENKIKKTRKKR